MVKDALRWVLVVVTCPCHVPLLAGLLAGTAAGAWLTKNMLTAMAVATVLFALSLLWLVRGTIRVDAGSAPTPGEREQAIEEVLCPSCASRHGRAQDDIALMKGGGTYGQHEQHWQAGRTADEAGSRHAG
jgi:hypothetical protein